MSEREELENALMDILRNASPDRYSPPTLREQARAVLDAGYQKVQ